MINCEHMSDRDDPQLPSRRYIAGFTRKHVGMYAADEPAGHIWYNHVTECMLARLNKGQITGRDNVDRYGFVVPTGRFDLLPRSFFDYAKMTIISTSSHDMAVVDPSMLTSDAKYRRGIRDNDDDNTLKSAPFPYAIDTDRFWERAAQSSTNRWVFYKRTAIRNLLHVGHPAAVSNGRVLCVDFQRHG